MKVFLAISLVFLVMFISTSSAFIKEKLLIGGAAAGAAGAVGAAGGFLAGSALPGLLHHRPAPVHHHVTHVHVQKVPTIKVFHEPIKVYHAPIQHGWDEGW